MLDKFFDISGLACGVVLYAMFWLSMFGLVALLSVGAWNLM